MNRNYFVIYVFEIKNKDGVNVIKFGNSYCQIEGELTQDAILNLKENIIKDLYDRCKVEVVGELIILNWKIL